MADLGVNGNGEAYPDPLAIRVFLKALELAGGPRKIIHYRNLTWISSLLEASYVVVLREEHGLSYAKIARELGISEQTVRNIVRADVEATKAKLSEELQHKDMKVHVAGGLAKWAYEEIKAGNESVHFLEAVFQDVFEILEVAWPIEVLRRIRGSKFPLHRDDIAALLKGLEIEGKPASQVVPKLPERVANPAELLKELKRAAE
ncbi:MAG: helix-turn-helix domain-containing protein [Chloroflexi bacterium]|nr:helix-turn-helix domain-containing protein [Chloroflexota bacterium]